MKSIKSLCGILLVLVCLNPVIYGKETGFKEIGKEKYDQDVLHIYEHKASGLQVIWIENQDVNKAFAIGVKTPTTNDTGVNHILEHTLFTGSRKYPSASLFFDASEAYPSTYMNALTSGDMTVFPFSTPYLSCYEKLLDIYLDVVFHPTLLEQPYGFYEEGYHHVPKENRDGGVVYNEMKGAYGSLERIVYRNLRNMIYKDTHYAYDSGGVPQAIPTLTYDEFVKTYKTYYYPGNMKIIIYGDVPIKDTLETISTYVGECKENKQGIDLSVDKLEEMNRKSCKVLGKTDKACITKSFVIAEKVSATEIQDLDLWMTAYLMSPQSYFQNQLLSQGMHVKWLKDDDLPYPIYTLVLTDIPYNKVESCDEILEKLLSEAPAHLNKNVFLEQDIIKEAKWLWEKQEDSNNRGVEIAQSILDAWAHDKETEQYFLKKEQISEMTDLNSQVGELLLKKAKRYTLILLPKETEEAADGISNLSDDAWNSIYEEMKNWQNKRIELESVDLKELIIYPEEAPSITKNDDCWEMISRGNTNLIRTQIYLNTSHISQEDLPYLFLYSYFFESSAKDITPFSGVIDTNCTAYPLKEGYWPCFKLSVVTPKEETDHGILFNQARNYLMNRSSSWYRQKLIEYTMNMKSMAVNNALSVLGQLCLAHGGDRGAYLYQQSYPLYQFCQELINSPQTSWIEQVKSIDKKLYHKGGIILSSTLQEKGDNKYAESWKKVIADFPKVPNRKAEYQFDIPEGNYIVRSHSAIDYSFKTMRKEEGIDGVDYLLAAYLTKNYLNPQIRVKMGAYGVGCQIYDLQTLGIYTYRDPDYRNSQAIILNSPDFLSRDIEKSDLNLSKAEAMSKVHGQFKLLGNELEKIGIIEHIILWGKSPKEVVGLQKEILTATPDNISERQNEFQKLLENGKTAIMTKKNYTKEQIFTVYFY